MQTSTHASGGPRILIFVVAYNAETTIQSVLDRIPVERLPGDTEVLVIDDASADRTFDLAARHRDRLRGLKLTVLFNPENRGYGGNQKIGYRYAIEQGFDAVVLLHGDGQYAPEVMPELLAPVVAGEADACFGSRMMIRGQARRQGMPLYKAVGNRILTRFQNRVLGLHLSEFHSGYRVYSVAALAQVPFRYNTDDFHFDTQIIIQLELRGLRIRELPIPTYYGDEICRVNGLAYAWNVCATTLASRLHRAGICYQRRFDVFEWQEEYDLKTGYLSSHTLAVDAVAAGQRVLDLACGPGYVAGLLRAKGCRVTGIDRRPAPDAAFDRFVCHDLDDGSLPGGIDDSFDVVLALDCIEHLRAPERLLETLRERCYRPDVRLILTTANIAFLPLRMALLFGQFNYGRQGILDLTHTRLFTFRSLQRMLEQEGFRIRRIRGIPAPFPKALGPGRAARALLAINRALITLWKGAFAYQIYVEADFAPPLSKLLKRTLDASRQRHADDSSVSPD